MTVQLRLKSRYSLPLCCFIQKTAICRHYRQLITHSLTHKPSLFYNADPLRKSHRSAVSVIRTTRYPTWAAMLLDAHWYASPISTDIYTQLSPVRDWGIKLVLAEQNSLKTMMAVLSPDSPWRGTFNHLDCVCSMRHVCCCRRSRNCAAIASRQ